MSGPTELSLEAVRDFIILNGGKVRNHDLVKHFKKFLTKPQNRGERSPVYLNRSTYLIAPIVLIR